MKMNMKEINLNEMEKAAGAEFPEFPQFPRTLTIPQELLKPGIKPIEYPQPEKPLTGSVTL